MVIAPPGTFKTTSVYTLDSYSDALCLGDVNIKSMSYLRDQMVSGTYRTLVFGELEKLYARNPATAANIEGVLKQVMEEGLRHFSFENPLNARMPARALIVAALTPTIYGRMSTSWSESGFLRRFLRMQYVMADPKLIMDSVQRWEKLSFEVPTMWNGRHIIKYNLDDKDAAYLRSLLRHQSDSTPFVLLSKIACVLKHRNKETWKEIIKDVSEAFGKQGALMQL